jgi:TolA-binding protein
MLISSQRAHDSMILISFKTTKKMLHLLLLSGAAFLAVAGCTLWQKTPPPPPPPPPKPVTRPHVDTKAQQQYYDLGLQHYSKENYGEAKEAFQQVVDLGPNSALGLKAQENLKKIDRVLKTLEELESK